MEDYKLTGAQRKELRRRVAEERARREAIRCCWGKDTSKPQCIEFRQRSTEPGYGPELSVYCQKHQDMILVVLRNTLRNGRHRVKFGQRA